MLGREERAVDAVKMSRTGIISCRRWSAELRARCSAEGAAGSVDWCCCFARMRESRLEEREVVKAALVVLHTRLLGEVLFEVVDRC